MSFPLLSSTYENILRVTVQRVGRAAKDSRRAWQRHVFAAEFRKELAEKHRRWCHEFRPPSSLIERTRRFLDRSLGGYRDIRWHEVNWSVSGILDPAFIPRDFFYLKIESTLNAMDYARVLTDKNALYSLWLAPHLPEPVLHVIRGDLYLPGFVRVAVDELDRVFANARGEFVVKPTIHHGGGQRVEIMDGMSVASFIKSVIANASSQIAVNWIVQRPLAQCAEMARFNSSSINTMRIMTLRTDREIAYVTGVLRVGRADARVDNQGRGGLVIGISQGRLRDRGIDKEFRYYDRHPDHDYQFGGELPAFDVAVTFCRELHQKLPWFDLISWDVTVGPQYEPRLIEFNVVSQEIDIHQLTNGPLFGGENSAMLSAVLRRVANRPLVGVGLGVF
jgi:putative polysaccharide biosynthesis protein